jgi:tetratricopeptide (TPR) repeat protein
MAIKREQVVQTAEKYVARGKIEPAIREYRKLLEENPNDINTLNRVGDLYARIQRIDEAVDFFNQIAEQYATEGFFVKAIAIYKKIIKLDPTRLDVYESLAELYHRQGLVTEARTQYQVLADYYQKHENATSAIAIYQKMTELEATNPTYHVKLAELYQQQKLTDKALGEYKVIAELMLQHGHANEAAQVFERALAIDSGNISFITDAALRLKEVGGNSVASRFLAAAIERNPEAERVVRLVGVSASDEGGPATIALERSVVRGPGAPLRGAAPTTELPRHPGSLYPGEPDTAEMEWAEAEAEPELELPELEAIPEIAPASPPVSAEPLDMDEIELDLDMDMDIDLGQIQPALGELSRPSTRQPLADELEVPFEVERDEPEPPRAAASPSPSSRTREDEDVFVLDIEDEQEPSSLVKPPPDMLEMPGRPAWAQESRPAPASPGVPPQAPRPTTPPTAEYELVDPFAGIDDLANPFSEAELAPPDTGELLSRLPSDLERERFTPSPQSPSRPPIHIDPVELEQAAGEVQPVASDREEDLVSEAEVLAKYGLEDKAVERLREALRLRPNHLGAYALLIQLQLEKGRHRRVAGLAQQMLRASREIADRDLWPKMRKRLLAAGYRVSDDTILPPDEGPSETEEAVNRVAAALLAEPAKATPPPPGPSGLPAELAARLADAARSGARKKTPSSKSWKTQSAEVQIEGVLEELRDGTKKKTHEVGAAGASLEALSNVESELLPADLPIDLDATMLVSSGARPSGLPVPPPAEPPHPAAPAAGKRTTGIFNPLEIAALVESEDLDWDQDGTAGAGSFTPPPPAVAPPPVSPPPEHPAATASAASSSLDDTGMSWLDEADAGKNKSDSKVSRIFDEEQDFFDLAGELEQELSKEEAFRGEDLLLQPAEQSLEEIVEGFKRGVAEHLSPTDYDTHFNLGIAYREMGLLDEAIGEFQLAAKDERHLVACCSMLGLCFLDKGIPELAVKWYRRGLDTPKISEEDTLGLLYDLGCVYVQGGDKDNAYKTFVEVYGINTNYRDVVARIEELGNPR